MVKAGQPQEAVHFLRELAASGDGAACYQLAEWHRGGVHVARDFAAARDFYRLAAQAGVIEGMRRYLAFWVIGVGGDRDWEGGLRLLEATVGVDPRAPRELALVRAMALTAQGDPLEVPVGEVLSETPRIVRFPGFFTADECAYLAEAAMPFFEPGDAFDERTGEASRNPLRTSDIAAFPWVGENPAIHTLNRRIAAATATDPMQGEPLHVLRYQAGGEYKPHLDAIAGFENQRILTMLVYLNDGYEGGETHFPEAGVTVPARRGDAILFENVRPDGQPDPSTIHASLPVRSGEKLVATRWIRAWPVSA
jgi:prolyl 4-hydroxylase